MTQSNQPADPIPLAQALIRCRSVTPADDGALDVMEAALRTVYEVVTGRPLPADKLHIKPIQGLKGLKEAELKLDNCLPDWKFLEGVTARVAVAHGLSNARKICEIVDAGKGGYHFIEVMCCPGGCIGGGGQPRLTSDEVRKARIKAIYKEDEGRPMRKSHDNPAVAQIYKEFLIKPLGEKSHHLLHTHYHNTQVDAQDSKH